MLSLNTRATMFHMRIHKSLAMSSRIKEKKRIIGLVFNTWLSKGRNGSQNHRENVFLCYDKELMELIFLNVYCDFFNNFSDENKLLFHK